jgi:methyl-accepting chemotaxis protein
MLATRTMRIFWRLTLPMGLSILLLTASIYGVARQLIDRSLTAKAYQDLADDVRIIDMYLVERGNACLSIAEMIQQLRRVQGAYAAEVKDKEALQIVADEVMNQFKVGVVTFTDEKGIVLARGRKPGQNGDSNFNLFGMQKVFTTGKPFVGFDTARAIPFLYVCRYPLTQKGGKLIGVVTIGFDMGTETFIDSLKKFTGGGELTLILKNEQGEFVRHQSTLRDKAGKRMSGKVEQPEVLRVVGQEGKPLTLTAHVPGLGREFYATYKPLTKDAEVFGMLAVFNDTQDNLETQAGIVHPLLYILLGFGALILALTALVVRKVSRPIGRIVATSDALAQGHFDAEFPDERAFGGELLVLYSSLKAMVGSLKAKIAEAGEQSRMAAVEAENARKAVAEAEEARREGEQARVEGTRQAAAQLEEITDRVSSASEELSSQVAQSSRGAEHQASRVAETATAMEEMNATVLEVAKNASQSAETTDTARRKAQEGARIVDQVVEGIGAVRDQAQTLQSDMDFLGNQARGISQILNVISDIADQTNLLALNAAIEAARAGDAGRGFAVVADEVRKLAEKTQSATKEVGEAIQAIQGSTSKNIGNVQTTVATIEKTTALAHQSGETLAGIVSLIDVASDQVRSIATASEQQSSTSEGISRSVEEINQISSDTAQAMSRASQAVSDLAGQAQRLRAIVQDMKK